MIINLGDISFDAANNMNVPVNIDVHLIGGSDVWGRPELHEYRGWWVATASNYLTRKHHVTFQSYCAVSPSRGELVAYIQKHARPLYQYALNAIDNLDQTNEHGYSGLEYWG